LPEMASRPPFSRLSCHVPDASGARFRYARCIATNGRLATRRRIPKISSTPEPGRYYTS
jgi:hypothetical protein